MYFYVHSISSSHSCIMSSTRTLDEVIEQSIELINIGSEGWIHCYMELTLLFPPENFDNYTIKKIVGKGSYGHVAKAVMKNSQKYVAIKKITHLFESLP